MRLTDQSQLTGFRELRLRSPQCAREHYLLQAQGLACQLHLPDDDAGSSPTHAADAAGAALSHGRCWEGALLVLPFGCHRYRIQGG